MLQSQFTVALIYPLTFLKLSVAADTLSANQTIRDGQVLVSEGEIFELGFFSPGNSNSRFLGIWYKTTPDVVIWVANRNNPIIDSQGILSIARNGTLLLKRGKTIIWSSNISSVASIPVVRLLNTGNLVIMNSTSQQNYIWQSFDYPCDTRLRGMVLVDYLGQGQDKYLTSWRSSHDPSIGDFSDRIEYNGGLVEMVVYHGKIKRSRRSPWSGHYTSNLPFVLTTPFKPVLVFNKDRISLYDNSSLITRLTLDKSGFIHRYTINESKNGRNLVHTFPRDSCDNYARCGPNGICRISQVPICECLKGFAPRFQKDWDVQDWSGGCVRITPINCQNGDGFLGVEANFPDRFQFQLNTSMSFNECKAQCSKSCSCTAFATPFIDGISSCLMWFGDLIDIREPPEADSTANIYIRLPASELGFLFKTTAVPFQAVVGRTIAYRCPIIDPANAPRLTGSHEIRAIHIDRDKNRMSIYINRNTLKYPYLTWSFLPVEIEKTQFYLWVRTVQNRTELRSFAILVILTSKSQHHIKQPNFIIKIQKGNTREKKSTNVISCSLYQKARNSR
ncbi:G-type lectin S-receptor-like serine/threonine-protein kinase At4g27290 [Olea europaea var. sylvestris]|uniref:G-type lectin S-receptor-like serine/threonine-protein kinase At4g27290 n=1 Tax=Olea europaea var. sylvestris TaxID=158386 RepID=UPI000C1D4103|nr:G-type lectin S-receptor-like serine/threonine-protein kinase At4g27290 [Olea europaea var. sylvestris]